MKTRIIVDSTTDLMPEDKERVHIVPLTLHFGDQKYMDGVTIDHKTQLRLLLKRNMRLQKRRMRRQLLSRFLQSCPVRIRVL